MYVWFYEAFLESQEDDLVTFDGSNNTPLGVVGPLDTLVPQDSTSLYERGLEFQEDMQTSFALRSLGIAAVMATADGPLPWGS